MSTARGGRLAAAATGGVSRWRSGSSTVLVALAIAACGGGGPSAPASGGTTPSVPASSSPSPPVTASPTPSVAGPPHVMVVVLENREYSSVIGDGAAPYINGLAARFGLATRSYGVTHPSLPNYLALVAGSTFGITSDCTSCDASGSNLADQLTARGVPWTAYMGGMPSPCYQGASYGDVYAKKHDPFMYFPALRGRADECSHIVPGDGLLGAVDGGTLPAFVWVTPDMCSDGHDCSTGTADHWVAGLLAHVLPSSWYAQGGAVILTWDEGGSTAGCCGDPGGGRIATLVVSAATPRGARLDQPVDHYGVLRTLETLYGLPFLGAAADAAHGDLLPLLGR